MKIEQRNLLCLKWEKINESERKTLLQEYVEEYGTYEPWAFWEEYLTRKLALTTQQTTTSTMHEYR